MRARRDGGFTAIEISMVATVIAILALIAMPIFRNRVEEAKIAAAQGDLASLMKAEILAKADTSFYFRLEDLDNVSNNAPDPVPSLGITVETPPMVFDYVRPYNDRAPLTTAEWRALTGTAENPKWKGPYIAFQRHETYRDAIAQRGTSAVWAAVLRLGTGATDDRLAPVWEIPQGSGEVFDHLDNRIPVDPWGNPYLFFPALNETHYQSSVIYCLGPNGLPGDGFLAGDLRAWRRVPFNGQPSPLGSDDDMQVTF